MQELTMINGYRLDRRTERQSSGIEMSNEKPFPAPGPLVLIQQFNKALEIQGIDTCLTSAQVAQLVVSQNGLISKNSNLPSLG